MGKRFLYGAFVLTFGIWFSNFSSVLASDITYSDSDSGIENNEGDIGLDEGGIVDGTSEGGETGEEIINDAELLDDGVSETIGEEVVKVQNKTFVLLDHIESGQATQTDIYNALVSIHNLGLFSFIVFLMVWTYNLITSAFRRFIG